MRTRKRTGEAAVAAPSPTTSSMPGETFTRVFITVDSALVILLAFAFAFGNGWTTAQRLGIHPYIAPLIQPAVDLAVIGLMVGLRYLAVHGWSDEQLKKPRRWLRFFGLMTLAMNTALPLHEGHYGRAAWDAIGPILLIAWSELAPWLLRAIYSVRQEALAVAALEATEAVEPVTPVQPMSEVPVVEEPEVEDEPDEVVVEDEPVAEELTALQLASGNTRRIAHAWLADWLAKGRTYEENPTAALHKLMKDDPRAFGMERAVSRERLGQLCREEWPKVIAEAQRKRLDDRRLVAV